MERAAKPKALLSWSSGKDCAYALHALRQQGDVEVVGLLTTVNAKRERVAMHAVRETLLALQAEAVGVPLWRIAIPEPCPNEVYEAEMAQACARARDAGVTAIAFGDLFLEDVRAYRETKLQGTGLAPIFPLWGRETAGLAREMMANGVRAHLTCVDTRQLDARFVGRPFDADLLAELPDGVDPCGERGEFHTFAWDGPAFGRPVPVEPGIVVEREGFVFADFTPVSAEITD